MNRVLSASPKQRPNVASCRSASSSTCRGTSRRSPPPSSARSRAWSNPSGASSQACVSRSQRAQIFDADVVKVVRGAGDRALYFSRAPIPWDRERFSNERPTDVDADHYRRHVGIYGFRARYLADFVAMPRNPLETLERLEQLRALAAGARVVVVDAVEPCGRGIDTAADSRARARKLSCPVRTPSCSYAAGTSAARRSLRACFATRSKASANALQLGSTPPAPRPPLASRRQRWRSRSLPPLASISAPRGRAASGPVILLVMDAS